MITQTQKEYLDKYTKRQKERERKRIKEDYIIFSKEVEGYKSNGMKLPSGLNTKKPIYYTFKVSKQKANKEHKITGGLKILRLPLGYKNDKKVIKIHLKLLNYLFKEDIEILKILKEIKEVLK